MSNASVNANGGAVAMPQEMPNEEQMDEIFRASMNNDPAKMREAAVALATKINMMADAIDGGKSVVAVAPVSVVETAAAAPIVEVPASVAAEVVSTVQAEVAVVPQVQVPQTTPVQAAVMSVERPTGYMAVPEGLYHWTPESWGGLALHGVPDRVIEKKDHPTLLIFVLVAPAYGRNRAGRVVRLPEGARVVIHANIAWAPIVPLAKGTVGRPVLWAAPTTVDPQSGVVRDAGPGEKILKYETGDGGWEYGMSIIYDPDPRDPTKPRLIDLETLRGAQGQ
jgi:hypothetical protein